ncbi:MAG: sulfite exporter TauE/SafE family protein [Phycisphaerales bacterium]
MLAVPDMLTLAAISPSEIGVLVLVGVGAGVLGGLLGIGGSIIMIPVLTLGFAHDQHISQAAAMIVNIVVALAGVVRHTRAKAMDWSVVVRILPAGLAAIVLGVEASNLIDGTILKRCFGAFLLYVIWMNVRRLAMDRAAAATARQRAEQLARLDAADDAASRADAEVLRAADALAGVNDGPHVVWWRATVVGLITGFAAGLLGIGGGIIAVPIIQRVLRLPLRRCITTSAAIMCVTAPIGALRKNLTLPETLQSMNIPLESPYEPLWIAACLAPTALLGSFIGAGLTHRLPLRWIRALLVFLLTWASLKFLGLV